MFAEGVVAGEMERTINCIKLERRTYKGFGSTVHNLGR